MKKKCIFNIKFQSQNVTIELFFFQKEAPDESDGDVEFAHLFKFSGLKSIIASLGGTGYVVM